MREGGEEGHFWCKKDIGRILLPYYCTWDRTWLRLDRLIQIGPFSECWEPRQTCSWGESGEYWVEQLVRPDKHNERLRYGTGLKFWTILNIFTAKVSTSREFIFYPSDGTMSTNITRSYKIVLASFGFLLSDLGYRKSNMQERNCTVLLRAYLAGEGAAPWGDCIYCGSSVLPVSK